MEYIDKVISFEKCNSVDSCNKVIQAYQEKVLQLEKENAELNELKANYLETLILRDKEIYCLKQTVSQRNIQIADLKHRRG